MATTKKKAPRKPARAKAAPWDKPAPKASGRTKLTAASRSKARSSAKKAGRPYPTLVDNMNAAKAQKKSKKAGKAKAPRKKSGRS